MCGGRSRAYKLLNINSVAENQHYYHSTARSNVFESTHKLNFFLQQTQKSRYSNPTPDSNPTHDGFTEALENLLGNVTKNLSLLAFLFLLLSFLRCPFFLLNASYKILSILSLLSSHSTSIGLHIAYRSDPPHSSVPHVVIILYFPSFLILAQYNNMVLQTMPGNRLASVSANKQGKDLLSLLVRRNQHPPISLCVQQMQQAAAGLVLLVHAAAAWRLAGYGNYSYTKHSDLSSDGSRWTTRRVCGRDGK